MCKDHCSVLEPGDHGSTFGGNALTTAAGAAAARVMVDEDVPSMAMSGGDYLVGKLNALKEQHPFIEEVRGMACWWDWRCRTSAPPGSWRSVSTMACCSTPSAQTCCASCPAERVRGRNRRGRGYPRRRLRKGPRALGLTPTTTHFNPKRFDSVPAHGWSCQSYFIWLSPPKASPSLATRPLAIQCILPHI